MSMTMTREQTLALQALLRRLSDLHLRLRPIQRAA